MSEAQMSFKVDIFFLVRLCFALQFDVMLYCSYVTPRKISTVSKAMFSLVPNTKTHKRNTFVAQTVKPQFTTLRRELLSHIYPKQKAITH